jgi:hypothetical protein
MGFTGWMGKELERVGGNGGMKLGLNKGGGGLLACINTVRERSASYGLSTTLYIFIPFM